MSSTHPDNTHQDVASASGSERSYDFLKDAEELRRMRLDGSLRETSGTGFARNEGYLIAAVTAVMVVTNAVALVFWLVR